MSGLAVAVDHAGRAEERVHLLDRKALIVISAVCASIGGISFRHHTRSVRAGSRAKGEQSYGSLGRFRIIFGSAGDTHLSLYKDAPASRAVQAVGRIVADPHLGGLHHQYLRI